MPAYIQTIENAHGLMSYGRATAVAAGARLTMADFRVPDSKDILGLSVGFGLSDLNAWNGGNFQVFVDEMPVIAFFDQISDLLRLELLPLALRSKQRVRIDFENQSALVTDAAVIARVEIVR